MARTLSSHLETCPGCQRTLDRLTSGEASWVESARPTDWRPGPALRRAIDRLKAEGEAGRDTAGPAAGAADTLPFLRPPVDPEHLGRLGPYEVLGVIGRGGMGVVLKAFDPALRRTVAIKVLSPQWASHKEARQRFQREARAAGQVRHENVVAIHSVEEADGLPYLVMEYVPGTSLQQDLDRNGPLAVEDILRIGARAAAGLAAAHARDLVHRDVKPANILLDEAGNVRLTDFGLARAVDDTSLTQTGVIAGTPQYMAPEQARGEKVDHRADLFSLGSVLYAMCTGRPPFRAPNTVAVLKRVCEEVPADVRDHNPSIPDWLAEIIDKRHAKRPRDRFLNAEEVAHLLTWHLAHLRSPETVEKPAPVARPRAPSRGLWVAALAVPGAVLTALLVWGVVYLVNHRPAANLPEPDNQAKQAQLPPGPEPRVPVPRGPAPRGPAPRAPAAKPPEPVEGGGEHFQKAWADVHVEDHFTRKDALERLASERLAKSMPNDQRAKVARKLVELTDVDDGWVRWGAIKALGVWGSKDDVPALIRSIAHSDTFTRRAALEVIGRFRDERTLPAVIHGFRQHSTRSDAARALRDLGPMAEDDVLAIFNEGDDLGLIQLKQDAILVLADIGTEKSVPALRKVLANETFHYRRLKEPAQKALAAIDQRKKR